MIEKVRGQFLAATPKGIIVDVSGVGYGLEVPLSVQSFLPEVGEEVDFWVHTYVREDAIRLYGFRHYAERVAFEILISLNGVGPKVALAILSTLSVDQLKKAIMLDRKDLLESVPGIGKRTAEKIFVELKPKLKKLSAASINKDGNIEGASDASADTLGGDSLDANDPNWAIVEDVRSALENFGFKEKAISKVLDELSKKQAKWQFQDLMRDALGELGSLKLEAGQNRNQIMDKLF